MPEPVPADGRGKQIGCHRKYGLRRLSTLSAMARQRLRRICRVQLQIRACMRSTEIGPSPGVCFRKGTPPKQLVLRAIAHTQGALLWFVLQAVLPPAPYSTLLFPLEKCLARHTTRHMQAQTVTPVCVCRCSLHRLT